MSSVRISEAQELTEVFNASSDVARLDPTFERIGIEDVSDLIRESVASEGSERGFRMQSIRLTQNENHLVGYFHLREATPRPDVVALTIFFIRPDFRTLGYGREVAERLIGHLSRDSLNRVVWARVYLRNLPAMRFWSRQGFNRIVEHKGEHIHVDGEHVSVILEHTLNRAEEDLPRPAPPLTPKPLDRWK